MNDTLKNHKEKSALKNVNFIMVTLFAMLSGCGVIGLNSEVTRAQDQKETKKSDVLISYSPANERVYFSVADKKMNSLPLEGEQSSTVQTLLCGGLFIDPSSYIATYKGFRTDFIGYASTDPVFITFEYQIEVGGNLDPNGSQATIQIPGSIYWPYAPAIIKTATPTWDLLSKYYDVSLDSDINVYKVTFSIELTNQTHCNYGTLRTKLKLNTDCSNIGDFTTNYTSWLDLTPNTYQPSFVTAWPGSAPGSINALTSYLLCSCTHCHTPKLGWSPIYMFEYRDITLGNAWQSVSIDNGFSGIPFVITGLISKHTYEYRFKGLISSPSTYGDVSAAQTLIVL